MHILALLVLIVGGVGLWLWRARMAVDTAREAVDVADDVRAAFRRFGYRRKHNKHPIESVEDPRLAAAALMASIIRLNGDPLKEQWDALRLECRASFRVDAKEGEEIAAFGRWLSGQFSNPGEAIRRLIPIVRDRAPEAAKAGAPAMLLRVAEAGEGGVSDLQRAEIDRIARGLGLD